MGMRIGELLFVVGDGIIFSVTSR